VSLEFWANVSTVWLSFLCFIGLIVAVVASVYAVKGMNAVVSRTPRYLRQAQGYSRLARTQVESASNLITEPVIQAHSQSRRVSMFVGRLFRRPASLPRGEKSK
jgi:hypothetical protein